MHILHILDHSIPLHSGYTHRTFAIVQQQRALGWETDHVTSPKHNLVAQPQDDEEDIDGLHFFRTRPSGGLLASLPFLNQWAVVKALEARLTQVVARDRPDILHAHSPALNGIAAVRVGRRYKIPVVYETRAFWEDAAVDHGTSKEWGLRYRATRALETYVFKRADAVTTICEGLRGDIIARGIPQEKVTVIPNAVDLSRFTFGADPDAGLARELGLEDKQVVGFIGSFYAYEGLPVLLKALPQVLETHPDVRVLLVGGGPQESALKQLTAQLNLDKQVIFTGRVPHQQVQRYYNLVDVFVYPRLSMRLTELVTPLKPLEAMAQGRLVLASDVGGHRELIRPGETGVLFTAGDTQGLATELASMLEQKHRWPGLREAARRYVEEERSWPASVARYQSVYEGLAKCSRGK